MRRIKPGTKVHDAYTEMQTCMRKAMEDGVQARDMLTVLSILCAVVAKGADDLTHCEEVFQGFIRDMQATDD
jgi:hypothetical protein